MARKLIRPTLSDLDLQRTREGKAKKKAKKRVQPLTHGLPISPKKGQGVRAAIILNDGEEIVGRIDWYDKSCIKVSREDGPNLVIMRHSIKYIAPRTKEKDKPAPAAARPSDKK